jgi:hypothetical protein
MANTFRMGREHIEVRGVGQGSLTTFDSPKSLFEKLMLMYSRLYGRTGS